MSGRMVGWAFGVDDLPPTQKLVLVALADNAADPSGKAWPSKGELIRKTGLSQATVYRALAELKRRELVIEADDERGREAFWLSHGENPFSQSENGSSHGENRTTYRNRQETSKADCKTIEALFDFWREATGRNGHTKLTDGRRQKLRERLRSYSPEEIQQAISNCAASEFHVEGGYTDLTLICRNDEKLEAFRDMGGGDEAAWEEFLTR